jgi:hypothetical protein
MLRIKNTHNLLGKGFHSNGCNWVVTHVKECIDLAQYIITIENYDNSIYYKFELNREVAMVPGEYWMHTIDKHNKMVDVNSIQFDNIKTRDSMLVELKFIMDKLNK